MVQNSKKVFIDTNYFCGLYNPKDTLNKQSINASKVIKQKDYDIYVSNYIILESLTIISQRVSKKTALTFWGKIHDKRAKIFYVDKIIQKNSFKIFKKVKSKNFSFVDATTLAFIKKYKINFLLTFDSQLIKIAEKLGIKSLIIAD